MKGIMVNYYYIILMIFLCRFHSTTAVYFKRADAFIIVYDVTSKNTFENVKTWLSLVKVRTYAM